MVSHIQSFYSELEVDICCYKQLTRLAAQGYQNRWWIRQWNWRTLCPVGDRQSKAPISRATSGHWPTCASTNGGPRCGRKAL